MTCLYTTANNKDQSYLTSSLKLALNLDIFIRTSDFMVSQFFKNSFLGTNWWKTSLKNVCFKGDVLKIQISQFEIRKYIDT